MDNINKQLSHNQLEVFVLCGGKSSRMGQDKGLIHLQGKPMVQHILDKLKQTNLPITLVTPDQRYNKFGYPLVADHFPENGPMGGLYTSLIHSNAKSILILGCDMPFLSLDAIEYLIEKSCPNYITVAEVNGRINPLFGIYPQEIIPDLALNILEGNLKMRDFILSKKYQTIAMSKFELINDNTFANVNTRDELEKMEHSKTENVNFLNTY